MLMVISFLAVVIVINNLAWGYYLHRTKKAWLRISQEIVTQAQSQLNRNNESWEEHIRDLKRQFIAEIHKNNPNAEIEVTSIQHTIH